MKTYFYQHILKFELLAPIIEKSQIIQKLTSTHLTKRKMMKNQKAFFSQYFCLLETLRKNIQHIKDIVFCDIDNYAIIERRSWYSKKV